MSEDFWSQFKTADNFVRGVQCGAQTWTDINSYECRLGGEATGFVYFITIGSPYPTHVKIGFTRKSPLARLAGLQTGCPFKMTLLGFIFGTEAYERELHDVLRDERLEGEWFEFSDYASKIIGDQLEAGYDL